MLNNYTDHIPETERAKIGDLRFEKDAIIIKNPAFGEMAFKVVERTPNHVEFKADGMIPLSLGVNLTSVDNDTRTDVSSEIDIEIPMMLRPLIGGKMQQVADMFGDLIAKLASAGNS